MAGKPIAMHHLRELILHFQRGVSIKESCRRLRISRNTVRRYRQQLAVNMDRLDDLLAMEQPELHAWFHPPQPELTDVDRYTDLVSRTPTIIAELRRKGVTRYLLWLEYRQDYVEGYGYSQFCYYLRQAAKQIDVSMVQHFAPGEVIFFDFAGHTMDVTDPYTGEVSPRQIFLATAGVKPLNVCHGCTTTNSALSDRSDRSGIAIFWWCTTIIGMRQSQIGRNTTRPIRTCDTACPSRHCSTL